MSLRTEFDASYVACDLRSPEGLGYLGTVSKRWLEKNDTPHENSSPFLVLGRVLHVFWDLGNIVDTAEIEVPFDLHSRIFKEVSILNGTVESCTEIFVPLFQRGHGAALCLRKEGAIRGHDLSASNLSVHLCLPSSKLLNERAEIEERRQNFTAIPRNNSVTKPLEFRLWKECWKFEVLNWRTSLQ